MQLTADDIDRFLETTQFEGYQSVPLPFGRSVPGIDRSQHAQMVLADRVRGKTLMDVGTFYGFYPMEAMRRGAKRAVGVEPDPERFRIATRVAELNGDGYEILSGRVEELPPDDQFDIVLFLKVIHHVRDPASVVRRLAAVCRELLIVEFRVPSHRPTVYRSLGSSSSRTLLGRASRAIRVRVIAGLMRWMEKRLPIVAIDDGKTYYFSPKAFFNLFAVHERLFDRIEFVPSASPSCVLALCYRPVKL